jgi:hypothetical protein
MRTFLAAVVVDPARAGPASAQLVAAKDGPTPTGITA